MSYLSSPPPPPLWVFDIECYVNYFLVMARNAYMGDAYVVYELFNDQVTVSNPLPPGTLISFNGNNYDMVMLGIAIKGATNATLKLASDTIILRNFKPWDMEREFGFEHLALDHIDLIEVAPGVAGLKIYGGRLHSQRLQDLPIEPSAVISPTDVPLLRLYCGNDLHTTIDLYKRLKPQIDLREEMGKEFGIDLRSKSDAQIAEAVIRSEVERRLGHKVYRSDVDLGYEFTYHAPAWASFQTAGMQQMLTIIGQQTFKLRRVATKDNAVGSVEMPPALDSLRIRIGRGVYKMGIGGLHSNEKCTVHHAAPGLRIVDRDVTSYYPSLIINAGICPPSYGNAFQAVYRSLLERRVAAKREGNKVINEALKIVLNGTFGKLGSMYSMMYAPDQMIAVTLTGQIALLMFIESLDVHGFEVISANTDGVVTLVPDDRRDMFEALVAAWEMTTGFNTEETEYAHLYAKDVNNYIAIKPSGEQKLKGLYAPTGLSKNVTNEVCTKAVLAYISNGIPLQETIYGCADIRSFLTIRQVKGGALYDGSYLGKAVRWYYAAGETRHFTYKTNGNKVARSEGARPLMELCEGIPADIDYQWYINEAQSILGDVGG